MDPNTQMQPAAQAPLPQPAPKASHKGYWLVIILILLLAAGACYGVYDWQHKKVNQLSSEAKASSTASTSSQSSAPSLVKDVSIAYDNASMPKKETIVSLTLPANLGVIEDDSDLNAGTNYSAYYTDSNGLLDRWTFGALGTSAYPSQLFDPNNTIWISDMSIWAASADASPVNYLSPNPSPTPTTMTLAEKTTFISQLKTNTAACAADSNKGFATNDKVFNICYYLQKPQAENGDYTLSLEGYATLDDQPVYLGAVIALPNDYQSALNAYIQALEQTTTVVQTNPNAS